MEITFIGIIVIILSIIAFFKDEDWLLYLTIFFSTFTAAATFTSGNAITPFKIPLLLWVLKQCIIFIKAKPKITIGTIKQILKENKVFTAFLIFTIVIMISVGWLFISGINHSYYDVTFSENRCIKFDKPNMYLTREILEYFAFIMILALKKLDEEKIRKILKVFLISTVCAVVWGFIQFALYYLNIDYPAFLFNNNPGYAQHYNQVMHGIKRINSIGTEPSVFSLNLLAALPIILIMWLYAQKTEKKYSRIISNIIVIAVIVCTILTTSTTAFVGLALSMGTLLIYLIVKYIKEKKSINYKKKIYKLIVISIISIIIAISIAVLGVELSKNMILERNNDPQSDGQVNDSVREEIKTEIENMDFTSAIKEITISKLMTGSGQQRIEREVLGFEIYSLSPVFGVGYISFRTFTLFTNILVNMGIVGLISFLYIIYTVLKVIVKNRKKDEKYFLIFLLSILGMIVAFLVSIPDLIYVYFWTFLVLGYKYFTLDDKIVTNEKENLIIGIDGRSLDKENKTGITTYMYETIKRLNELDNDNIYYIYVNKSVNFDFELKPNFKIRQYEAKRGTLVYYYLIPKILHKDNVDIFWGPQHLVPIRNKYTKNIKYILTVHDLAIHKLKTVGEWKNTIILKLFLKQSCKNSDLIMADSKATKDDIVEIFKIKEDKIKVVYLGTNFTGEYNVTKEQEEEIANKFNIKNKDYLFFLSTIEPRKNLDTAISAFEKYKDEKKNDLKFIISGGVGWKCEKTLEMIDNSKYKDDIIRTGYITKEEKEYFFKNCKAFLYPSLYEGFGLPILEAMARGTIVVTSNISSIPEVGGEAAFYLNDVHSENELANLIEKVLKLDEESKKVIIEKGYNQVEKFTWEKCAKELVSILTEKNKTNNI